MNQHTQERRRKGCAPALWGLLLVTGGCAPLGPNEVETGTESGTESAAASGQRDVAEQTAALRERWAEYTVNPGAHSATISGGSAGNPVALFSTVSGRDFQLKLNGSAMYVITKPTQPEDQLDWNKLPGFSDCGTLDLSVNGAMFGWRWRIDLTPPVLEITAYANNHSKHLWAAAPLLTLDAADLMSEAPLRYRVWIDGTRYQFAVSGSVRGRTISATTTLPRACAGTPAGNLKWASGLYFGGTSVAPSKVTAQIAELPFRP
ncbi:MAG: hypothetical protein JNM40_12505 [Myxococcales bacterium]|nr:hypothetical protein [Myxococcales bacterium]